MTAADRRAEIAAGLDSVRRRIDVAARAAGRDPAAVALVVVTKTFPATDIRALHELGVRDVGENRHQEASAKAAELADLPLTWHFVGHLQSNKAGAVSAYADLVHSLDSGRLVRRLSAGAHVAARRVGCLIQVDLDEPDNHKGRSGAAVADVERLADLVGQSDGLVLRGVMGVAPLGTPAAPAFATLAAVAEQVALAHPGATIVSAGMSGDLEDAIAAGATHVRVGRAVLGSRPPLR